MKRYKLIDRKTGKITEYGTFEWELSWKLVFILGIGTGILIGFYWL